MRRRSHPESRAGSLVNPRYDVVVVGAGINGMVAAAELAGAGLTVALIDQHDRIGGFIASAERTVPGFVHDVYSSWHPLFVAGGAYAALGVELHARGLAYKNTEDAVTAGVSAGRTVVAYRDPGKTAEAFEHPADRDAYHGMLSDLEADAEVIFGALGSELRSPSGLQLAWRTLKRKKFAGSEVLVHQALMSGRGYLRSTFTGWEVDQLWTPWLLHAGLSPDHATGGIMLPVLAMSMHGFGLPVVEGGSGTFVSAFESLLKSRGVDLILGRTVERILVDHSRATGVRLEDGDTITAAHAVLASVTPDALYGRLLPETAVSKKSRIQSEHYRYGRGAMQVHLALDRPVDWSDDRLNNVALIHLTTGAASTGIACAQAEAGQLPAEPTVVVGQQSILDPTRAPHGKGTLWIQLQEVPYRPAADAAGMLRTDNGWDEDLKRGYLDRVLNRIGHFAPNLESSILGTDVIAPTDLETANPNARFGDPYGGSAELDQNLLWRPILSAAGHRTAIRQLWHIGSSTHPGPGLGGGSGHMVAQTLLAKYTRKRR